MRVIAWVALSSLLVAPGLAGADGLGPLEGRTWEGRFQSWDEFESPDEMGELQLLVGLNGVAGNMSLTFYGGPKSTEYSGTVLSADIKEGRVILHGKLEKHRTSGFEERKPFDTGWQPVSGELTITIEGQRLPTDPYKVDVLVGTLKFAGASPDVPEWRPGTQATTILSSFSPPWAMNNGTH